MSYPEGYTTSMISSFAHCSLCLNELPKHLTPQEYSWIECGINFDKKFLSEKKIKCKIEKNRVRNDDIKVHYGDNKKLINAPFKSNQ